MLCLIFNIKVSCITNRSPQTFQIQYCKINKSNEAKLPNHFESFQIENNKIIPLYFQRKGVQNRSKFFSNHWKKDCTSMGQRTINRGKSTPRQQMISKQHSNDIKVKQNNTRHLIYNRNKPIKLDLEQYGEGYRHWTMWLSSSCYRFWCENYVRRSDPSASSPTSREAQTCQKQIIHEFVCSIRNDLEKATLLLSWLLTEESRVWRRIVGGFYKLLKTELVKLL